MYEEEPFVREGVPTLRRCLFYTSTPACNRFRVPLVGELCLCTNETICQFLAVSHEDPQYYKVCFLISKNVTRGNKLQRQWFADRLSGRNVYINQKYIAISAPDLLTEKHNVKKHHMQYFRKLHIGEDLKVIEKLTEKQFADMFDN